MAQEVRAKRELDRIALLARAKVNVLRDGQQQAIDPAELVQGDVVALQPGDQIPVDGVLLSEDRLEVDESQLTGESDLVAKTKGEPLLSGSFCVTGAGLAEATQVGEASFANKLATDARKFQTIRTPLQREINRLLRVLILLVAFLMLLTVLDAIVFSIRFGVFLNISSVITGMVSAGLLTIIILNYSWGAIRIGQRGGLVQQINAVESLSNVTVLCTDKTGTLTANKLKYHDVFPVGIEKGELEKLLADFSASAAATNKTGQAISDGLGGVKRAVVDEVPFASARKWSALAMNDAGGSDRPPQQGVYVLGAPEMLLEYLRIPEEADEQLRAWTDQGLRVLVFAGNRHVNSLHDEAGEPALPPLTLLGVVSLSDELRPHLKETLESFTSHGVRLKVISGDNPQTVAALAKQAGLPGDMKQISGPELSRMSPAEFEAAAAEVTIFGRITPQQKEALVDVLRHQGEYVAMIGDGVNDVLSVKKANMGIAMESGSSATRAVANMVLAGRFVRGAALCLHRGAARHQQHPEHPQALHGDDLLAGAAGDRHGDAPDRLPLLGESQHVAVILCRGIPPIALALWARPGNTKVGVYQGILHFTLPAAGLIFLFGLAVYMGSFFANREGPQHGDGHAGDDRQPRTLCRRHLRRLHARGVQGLRHAALGPDRAHRLHHHHRRAPDGLCHAADPLVCRRRRLQRRLAAHDPRGRVDPGLRRHLRDRAAAAVFPVDSSAEHDLLCHHRNDLALDPRPEDGLAVGVAGTIPGSRSIAA